MTDIDAVVESNTHSFLVSDTDVDDTTDNVRYSDANLVRLTSVVLVTESVLYHVQNSVSNVWRVAITVLVIDNNTRSPRVRVVDVASITLNVRKYDDSILSDTDVVSSTDKSIAHVYLNDRDTDEVDITSNIL